MIKLPLISLIPFLVIFGLSAGAPIPLPIPLLGPSSAQASAILQIDPFSDADPYGLSPYWDWKTIETPNFRITFPSELREIANRSANLFEEAHQILSPILQWQPPHKTQILLLDNQDSANGLTQAFQRFGLILWVTPPDSNFSTAYYDDWLRFLILHEYTHLLNLDSTSGFWEPLRFLFGDTLLPNGAWPPWMLEGLAVYMETRFTTAGRGRSPGYDMMTRAAVEAGVLNSPDFITLDKINGTNPYFPGGDTRYQFGYHLMNQVGMENHGEYTLGKMSIESSFRIPFFINGNLENITGKDWYSYWDDWVDQSRKRADRDLAIIRSQPLTQYTLLTSRGIENSNDVEGAAVSPDGKWIAYTLSSANQRSGLYLKDLQSGETKRLDDKLGGVGLSFTPDSKALICSQLLRDDPYYTYSDLVLYFIEKNKRIQLSNHLRARDPDISPDGKWVTFTLSEHGVAGLARAPLLRDQDPESTEAKLGPVEKLYMPKLFDHVGNPRYSVDGEKIYFSFHPNGKSREDLLEYELKTQKITAIVSDKNYNRFPVQKQNGDLYYVSNATGVDNLYQLVLNSSEGKPKPVRVTNVTTGISFPALGPLEKGSQTLYASVFSYAGWDLAKIQIPPSEALETLTPLAISPPPAPPQGRHSLPSTENKTYPIEDYSIFPSIWPRSWGPLLGIDPNGTVLGGELMGFDAVNLHRYVFAGTYDTRLGLGEGYAIYSNRSWGPALDLQADLLTPSATFFSQGASYSRQLDFRASLSFPWFSTYSTWVPAVSVNIQKLFYYLQLPVPGPASNFLVAETPSVPSIDASLTFSNVETSPLAITGEGGRFVQLGSRVYLNSSANETIWKLLGIYQEYIPIAGHSVLVPSIKAQWASQTSPSFTPADANLAGRGSQALLGNSLGGLWGVSYGNNFNQLSVRGYPNTLFLSKFATVAALDFQFPLLRIFRGWGTRPAFFDNLYGTAFVETSWLPFPSGAYWLPSAGGAVRLSTELFLIPIIFSADYQKGFNSTLRGVGDFFIQTFVSLPL